MGTFFEFAIKGLELLGFKKSLHFDLTKSGPKETDPIIKLDFFGSDHKQYVQYISPALGEKLKFAELVLIDEAAAIPLPLVRNMLGSWPLFISSTIHGYEGTGRSLSLKLIKEINSANLANSRNRSKNESRGVLRPFKEFKMEIPIRYAVEDPIESWLYDLLCLNVRFFENLTIF